MAIETPTAAYALPANNGGTSYTFSFTTTEADDVVVYLFNTSTGNYDLKTVTADYTLSGSTVTFNSAPATQVLIIRRTDFNTLKIPNFIAGSSIRGQDLDSNFLQLLRVSQEFRDLKVDKLDPEVWADLDMNNNRIEELGAAAVDTDAVNRLQLGNIIASDITGITAQGIQLTKTQSGSNSGDEMVISGINATRTQKGVLSIDEGEGIDLTFNSGAVNVAAEISSKTNKGVVSINEGEGIDVTYTNGDAVVSAEDSSKTNKGVVSINEAHAIGVAYTNGDAVISADKSTASQQGVVKITATAPIDLTRSADGEVALAINDGTVDLAKIKADDLVTSTEQNAAPDAVGNDDEVATFKALNKRHDTIYQSGTPSGSDFTAGKLWYDHANDQTLYVWNGSNWLGISSGGTFVTQPTVIWVDSVNGLDSNDGHRVIDAMKTIKAAVTSADAGDIVLVAPGIYREIAPIDITVNNLSIVGQSLRSCFVHPTPATELNSLFRVNSGTQIQNFSFGGLKASGTRGGHAIDSDNTYGLPANQAFVCEFYPNSVIYKSPYIQNCTNFADSGIYNHTQAEYNANNALGGFFDPNNVTQGGFGGDLTSGPTGGGLLVDGAAVSSNSPLRSMVVDSFTQITLDGPGILCANNGYAQLVSFFGTFCHYHAKALNGGQLNLSNCTTDYGRYGLIADGKSLTANFTAPVSATAATGATVFTIGAQTAGSGWYGSATRPQDNMSVVIGANTYPVKSAVANGGGWDVTIENPNPAALATNRGLTAGLSVGDVASFFNRSYISTGGHTFEYVGAGTDYRAAPENGGIPVEANQVKNLNNGKVFQSSTDHNGKFKVGETFTVDQRTGEVVISLDAYRPELVNDLSPQLGANLDVNGKDITGTVKLNGVTYPASDGATDQVLKTDGSGNLAFIGINQLSGAGLQNLSDDSTPQLGSNLDVVTYDIVSTSNRDIDLDPNGSGSVVVKGNATRGSGNITLNCENNSHGVKLKGPAHSAGANYTMTLPTALPSSTGQALTSDTNGNLSYFNPVADGSVTTAKIADNAVTGDKLADDIVIAGNLTVNGTTTTVNSTTLTVDDKNIELGSVSTPSDTTADGGGITVKGATDKTLNWVNSTDSWTFNQSLDLPAGTASAPSLLLNGDVNTGLYQSAADEVAVSTAGTERLRVGPAGQVGIAGANYGTTGQVLMSNGASASPTWGDAGGSPTFEATASGAITNGKAVQINTNGTVSAITGGSATQSIGSPTAFYSGGSGGQDIQSAYDPDQNKFVTVFTNYGGVFNDCCMFVVGTLSADGSSVSFTTGAQIGSFKGIRPRIVYDTHNNKFLVAARNYNGGAGALVTGTWNGSGYTWSSVTSLSSSNYFDFPQMTFDSSNNRVVLVNRDGSNNGYGCAQVIDLANNTITVGAKNTFGTNGEHTQIAVTFDSHNNKVVYLARVATANIGGAYVGTVNASNNTISFGSVVDFDTQGMPEYCQACFDPVNNKVFIGYFNLYNSGNYGTIAKVGTVSGTSISFGTARVLENANTSYVQPFVYDPVAKRVVAIYTSSVHTENRMSILSYDATASYFINVHGNPLAFQSSHRTYGNGSIVFHPPTGKILFFHVNEGNSYSPDAHIIQVGYTNTTLTASNYIGISDASYSDGQTATIQVVGSVDDAQSGLTPGITYYVQANGTLGSTADTPSVEAGVGVAATKLLIK